MHFAITHPVDFVRDCCLALQGIGGLKLLTLHKLIQRGVVPLCPGWIEMCLTSVMTEFPSPGSTQSGRIEIMSMMTSGRS